MTSWRVIEGDALDRLRELEAGSVQACVTSPPYFGLRDYGTGRWEGGDEGCDHVGRGSGRDGRETPGGRGGSFPKNEEPFRETCSKCGATRIDSQIGLEPTPDLYVQALVEVFREVRRVLRDDGTLWLNLGDSYADNANSRSADGNRSFRADRAAVAPPKRGLAGSMKPKDLLGIPWRVAQALQEPYYTGTIKDERDRIWLAAMIDAEGCMFIHKRKVGQSNGQGYVRKNDSYGAGMEISSTDRCIVDRVMEITGRGSICEQSPDQNARRKQTIYRWNLRSNECRDVIREVYPHLVAKQHEARLVLGCPSSGSDAARAHESLKSIHQGGTPDIDFAAPASMFERGWFLRSDIIWAKLLKPNPMPEPVTDRPTRSHEHIFLFSKRRNYFYDSEAIREDSDPAQEAHNQRYAKVYDGPATAPENGQPGNVNNGGIHSRPGPGGRNKRDVWTVATQPFSGWGLADRRVPVPAGAEGDDIERIGSPDCPVHEGRSAPAPTVRRGGRAAPRLPRSLGSDVDPAQEQLGGFAPTVLPAEPSSEAGSSDSPGRSCAPAASPRSTGSRRTALAPATSSACTPSARTPDRTGDTSEPRAGIEQRPDISGRSSDEDGSGDPQSSGSHDRTAHRPSPQDVSACTCKWYRIERTDHFAVFPPKLIEPCILAGSAVGDTVLDPFAGAGTTGVVATRHGRGFVGIELNPAYAEMARQRIRDDAPLMNYVTEVAA